jgi:hypothetical protein
MKKVLVFLISVLLISSCQSNNGNNDTTIIEYNTLIGMRGKYARIYIDPLDRMDGWHWDNNIHNLDWIINYPEFGAIIEMCFVVVDIDKIDFSPLFTMEKLQRIEISCHDDSLVDFPDFSGIKNLKQIEINDSSICSFANIGNNLPDIEELYITGKIDEDIEIINLDCLSEIKTLKRLFLPEGINTNYSFSDFSGLSNLEWFKTHTSGFIDFKGCEKLTSLKYIEAGYCTPKNIQCLGRLSMLEELHLRIDNGVTDIDSY